MAHSNLKGVSLFSGCGGFDWGASQAGVEIIWANDIDQHAADAYRSLFPEVEFVLGDIRTIKSFPRADVLIGCYPCTGFSVGARRKWGDTKERNLRANPNNYLYEEFLRALEQIQPKYLFVENVRGMLSAEKGWFFDQQLEGFRTRGYKVQHQLLDASHFGIPQMRKRVFIVGVKEDLPLAYTFPKATHGTEKDKEPFVVLEDVIKGMSEWPKGEYIDRDFHGHYLTRNRKRAWDELSYTIVAHGHHVPLHPLGEPMRYVGKDTWELQGEQNRRLSWRECAAIQGLPSLAVPSGTLMDKYRVVGNAVPPAFGKALLGPIVTFERGS